MSRATQGSEVHYSVHSIPTLSILEGSETSSYQALCCSTWRLDIRPCTVLCRLGPTHIFGGLRSMSLSGQPQVHVTLWGPPVNVVPGPCCSLGASGQCWSLGASGPCHSLGASGQCWSLGASGQCWSLRASGQCWSLGASGQCRSLGASALRSMPVPGVFRSMSVPGGLRFTCASHNGNSAPTCYHVCLIQHTQLHVPVCCLQSKPSPSECWADKAAPEADADIILFTSHPAAHAAGQPGADGG